MLRMAHENRILARCDMAEALSKDVCRIHWARWRNRLQDGLALIMRKHPMSDVVDVVKPVGREEGTVTNTENGSESGNGNGNKAQERAGRGRKRCEAMMVDSNNGLWVVYRNRVMGRYGCAGQRITTAQISTGCREMIMLHEFLGNHR